MCVHIHMFQAWRFKQLCFCFSCATKKALVASFGPSAPGMSFWQVGYQESFLCAHPRSNLLLRIWIGGAVHHWVSLAQALQLILFGTIRLPWDGSCQADRDPVVWENVNPSLCKSFWRRQATKSNKRAKKGANKRFLRLVKATWSANSLRVILNKFSK